MARLSLFTIFLLTPIILNGQFKNIPFNLNSKNVQSFIKDARGNEWIGTDEGLNLVTPYNTYTFFGDLSNKNAILNSNIFKLLEIDNNRIVAFSEDGLSVFNPDTFSFKRVELPSYPINLYKNPLKNNKNL